METQEGLIFKNGEHGVAFNRFLQLHPVALIVFFDLFYYCRLNKLPFVVTDTVTTFTEDKMIGRINAVHREFRAFDLSVSGWSQGQIATFRGYFNQKYKAIAAIASGSQEPELIPPVEHGTAPHFHIQIRRDFNLAEEIRLGKKYNKEFL